MTTRHPISKPGPTSTIANDFAIVTDGQAVHLQCERPLRELNSTDALIAFQRGLVDGLDLEAARGLFNHNGGHGGHGVLGRSFVGTVEALGEEAPRTLRGRRVVAAPIIPCGTCTLCTRGLAAQCAAQKILGVSKIDGCFSDKFIVPAVNLTLVPDDLDDDHAVFAGLVASAIHAARQLSTKPTSFITVLGGGRLGLVLAQVLAHKAPAVRLLGRHSETLALAERWGIKHRHIDDVRPRADQDIVIDCTGSPSALAGAQSLVRPRGVILMKSIFAPSGVAEQEPERSALVKSEITIQGSGLGAVGGSGLMRAALGTIQRREVDVTSLISRRYSLREGLAAFQYAAEPGVLGVLIS